MRLEGSGWRGPCHGRDGDGVRGAEAGVIYMAEIVGIGTRFGNSRRRDRVGRVDEDIAIIE